LRLRPTSDRLRETLFNILAPRVTGSSFLDICAGSGAVAIEALSRGATRVALIEQSRRACSIIIENLESLEIAERADVMNRDAVSALKRLARDGWSFDIAYFDPPYASGMYTEVMETLATSGLIAPEGLVVVEHRAKVALEPEYGYLRVYREVKQGESILTFYARV
jgi:16S rRNA (guanine(966)-N(2))-methyltransferase RsmD